MCAPHWWRVPAHMRARLFAAWRTRKADPRSASAQRRYHLVSWECARAVTAPPVVEGRLRRLARWLARRERFRPELGRGRAARGAKAAHRLEVA